MDKVVDDELMSSGVYERLGTYTKTNTGIHDP